MKIQTLFDLLGASQDFLSHFDKVSSPEQLVSRIAILRRQDPENMLYDILALRAAVDDVLNAHIELGGALADDNDKTSNDGEDMEELLASFDKDESESKSQTSVERQEATAQEKTPGDQPTITNTIDKENPPS